MRASKSHVRHKFAIPEVTIQHTIPLYCIAAREVSKVTFLKNLRALGAGAPIAVAVLLLLAMICSTVLGLRSDKGCRRKWLLSTMAGTSVAMILLAIGIYVNNVPIIYVALGLDAIVGSAATPIARAAYFDVWDAISGYRFKDRLATDTLIVQAIPWVLLSVFPAFFDSYLLATAVVLTTGAVPMVIGRFKDPRDQDQLQKESEIAEMSRKYLKGFVLRLFVAFLVWDLAFQLINYVAEELGTIEDLRKDFLLVEGLGILMGTFVARLLFTFTARFRSSYRLILFFASTITVIFILPWASIKFPGNVFLDSYTLLLFSTAGGVLLALTFGFLSHQAKPHETGLLFGVLESIEILAEGVIALLFLSSGFKSVILINLLLPGSVLALVGLGLLLILKAPKSSGQTSH